MNKMESSSDYHLVFFTPTKHMISCEAGYNTETYLDIILKSDKSSHESRGSTN